MPKDEKVSVLDVNKVIPVVPQSLEELEELMEKHQKQNPVKFAQRSAEFAKLREQLGGKKSK